MITTVNCLFLIYLMCKQKCPSKVFHTLSLFIKTSSLSSNQVHQHIDTVRSMLIEIIKLSSKKKKKEEKIFDMNH